MDSRKIFDSDKRLREAIDFWVHRGYLIVEQKKTRFQTNKVRENIDYILTPDGELLANLVKRLNPLPSKGQFTLLVSILEGRINEVM